MEKSKVFASNSVSKVYAFPLNWMAVYQDEENKFEKEFINSTIRNDFYKINQEKIEYFGLYGRGNTIYFNKEGHFFINKKQLSIDYKFGNETISLTNSEAKKDLITFKKAYVDYDFKNKTEIKTESGIAVGYKYLLEHKKGNLYVTAIIHIPNTSREEMFLELSLTSDTDLDGKLVFNNEIKTVEEFQAPLKKGHKGTINWEINL